jgi:demethylmenaquinone methyltransferase/2-methoxy-6-polyprenyl-1,4-benzoquinol methylase
MGDRAVNELLASQADYYRRRAAEYDATAYGDVEAARARIARVLDVMAPSGAVLEIACGTGLWTEALAARAVQLTAIDAAPEAIAIARLRVARADVGFEAADVFSWSSPARFDVIFFSAWLSHVPASRFDQFWDLLRSLLADGGRVLFVDEHIDERDKERYLPGDDEVVERELLDGSRYRIVKNFIDPPQLEGRLRTIGWDCRIDRDDDDWVWVLGEARPVA